MVNFFERISEMTYSFVLSPVWMFVTFLTLMVISVSFECSRITKTEPIMSWDGTRDGPTTWWRSFTPELQSGTVYSSICLLAGFGLCIAVLAVYSYGENRSYSVECNEPAG